MSNKTTIYKKVEKVPILKVKKNEEETVKLQRKQELLDEFNSDAAKLIKVR